jgi:MFS family permease
MAFSIGLMWGVHVLSARIVPARDAPRRGRPPDRYIALQSWDATRFAAYRSIVTPGIPPATGAGTVEQSAAHSAQRAASSSGKGRPSVRGLLPLWRVRGLRRLVFVRVLSSFGDGAFQGALAVLVLFSPERQTDPAQIAAGFAVLLLPYSIIGPFAGALLDRWSRRRVIVWANLIRCALVAVVAAQIAAQLPSIVLFVTALFIMGVGRFVGSGLSASVPHTVAKDSLVGANALTTTTGAVAAAIGGGYAIAMRGLLGDASGRIALITASVLLFYLAAALVATRFRLMELGPDDTDEPAQPLRAVLEGLTSALHHVWQRPTVGMAILVVMAVRFCFGICTLVVLLLFQRYFTHGSGILATGATGIAEVLAVGALGVFVGAVVTAPMVRSFGRTRYLVILLSVASVLVVAFGCQFTIWSTLVTTFVVGFAYQSSKVCMDTVVQADSDDAYVGRVFALYDTANNLCYVGAFIVGAALVPADGAGVGAVILVAALFLVTGLGYGLAMSRMRSGPVELDELDLLVDPPPVGTDAHAHPIDTDAHARPIDTDARARPIDTDPGAPSAAAPGSAAQQPR